MPKNKKVSSPIKSGWRGHINGHVQATNGTQVNVGSITVTLDPATAHALCNLLHENELERSIQSTGMSREQVNALCELGAAIGRFIDHNAANNCGRDVIS